VKLGEIKPAQTDEGKTVQVESAGRKSGKTPERLSSRTGQAQADMMLLVS